jgi:hypothetical protein
MESDQVSTATPEEFERRYLSFLPPFFSRTTVLEELAPNLWGLTQPLQIPGQADIRIRMVVARLEDGSLLLCGPVAPTGEALRLLSSLDGAVRHIIIPNTSPEHYIYGPAMAAAFPAATLWTLSGFFQGKGVPLPGRSLLFSKITKQEPHRCRSLGVDALPNDLVGALDCAVLDVPLFLEAAVHLPRHRAIIFADSAVFLSSSDPEYAKMGSFSVGLAKQLGIWDRVGPLTKPVFERYPTEGKEWAERVFNMAAECDYIVTLHGSAPSGPCNVLRAVEDCFEF